MTKLAMLPTDVLQHLGDLRRVRGRPAPDAHSRRDGDRPREGSAPRQEPKLTARRQKHLVELHEAGKHNIAELSELFNVSRATVYRTLERARVKDGAGA